MAAFRRRLDQHPTFSGLLGGFLGLAGFGGAAWLLGASTIVALLLALLGFLLGAAALLIGGGTRGDYETIDAGLRDGRGEVEKLRSQIPYNQQLPPGA